MVSTLKHQAARQLEARGRAQHLGVRTYVIEPGRHYVSRSQSEPGVRYRLDRTRRGWTCECPRLSVHWNLQASRRRRASQRARGLEIRKGCAAPLAAAR